MPAGPADDAVEDGPDGVLGGLADLVADLALEKHLFSCCRVLGEGGGGGDQEGSESEREFGEHRVSPLKVRESLSREETPLKGRGMEGRRSGWIAVYRYNYASTTGLDPSMCQANATSCRHALLSQWRYDRGCGMIHKRGLKHLAIVCLLSVHTDLESGDAALFLAQGMAISGKCPKISELLALTAHEQAVVQPMMVV